MAFLSWESFENQDLFKKTILLRVNRLSIVPKEHWTGSREPLPIGASVSSLVIWGATEQISGSQMLDSDETTFKPLKTLKSFQVELWGFDL